MFGFINKYIIIGMTVTIALLGLGFYVYYTYSQKEIATLNRNNAKLETAVGIQKDTIIALESQRDLQAQNIIDLMRGMTASEIEKDELRKKLNRHDLEKIGRAKAGLLEKAINSGTDKTFKDLENETSTNR